MSICKGEKLSGTPCCKKNSENKIMLNSRSPDVVPADVLYIRFHTVLREKKNNLLSMIHLDNFPNVVLDDNLQNLNK